MHVLTFCHHSNKGFQRVLSGVKPTSEGKTKQGNIMNLQIAVALFVNRNMFTYLEMCTALHYKLMWGQTQSSNLPRIRDRSKLFAGVWEVSLYYNEIIKIILYSSKTISGTQSIGLSIWWWSQHRLGSLEKTSSLWLSEMRLGNGLKPKLCKRRPWTKSRCSWKKFLRRTGQGRRKDLMNAAAVVGTYLPRSSQPKGAGNRQRYSSENFGI